MNLLRKPVVRVFALLAAIVVGALAGVAVPGCTPAQTTADVTTAITVEQTLCILNNSLLKSADVATACGITSALIPAIEQIVGAHKAAEKREGLAR